MSSGSAQTDRAAVAPPDRWNADAKRARFWGVALTVLLGVIIVLQVSHGPTEGIGVREVVHAALAKLGLVDALPGTAQVIAELRLYRALVSVGVGAALALSGALLQAVFRNQLASPSLIGVTTGASLGASVMMLLLSTSLTLTGSLAGLGPLLTVMAAFGGAALCTGIVTVLSTTGGRISVPTMLLVGIALNAIVGGAIAAIQRFAVEDADLMRALLTWTFGRLEDREGYQVVVIWAGLAVAMAIVPRIARELDLFAAGEDDAHALGVDTTRVKWLALGCAALTAALAVAVAGQIGFVGLIAPHILRNLVGRSNRHILLLSLVGGPVLLCGADLGQRLILGYAPLPPGVMMSLLGGPFFIMLLLKNKKSVEAW